MAYQSDAAVIVLRDDLGSRAGTFGLRYSPAGYQGRLYTAGYPGQSVTSGRFFSLRGPCVVSDGDGDDGQLMFQVGWGAVCGGDSAAWGLVWFGLVWFGRGLAVELGTPQHTLHTPTAAKPLPSQQLVSPAAPSAGPHRRPPSRRSRPQSANRAQTCASKCAIAEAGQSGQPAWEVDSEGRAFILAVLSHGPPVGTCKGAGAAGVGLWRRRSSVCCLRGPAPMRARGCGPARSFGVGV